jgi:hypothetical protein
LITDLDSTVEKEENGKKKWVSAPTARGANQKTNNDALKSWFPKKDNIDELLGLSSDDKKQDTPFPLRVAFQTPITVDGVEILPYTFEESIIFENKDLISAVAAAKGMMKKAQSITDTQTAFDIIRESSFKKAEFALDLLYLPNFEDLKVPAYIAEGLTWLNNVLQPKIVKTPLVEENTRGDNA